MHPQAAVMQGADDAYVALVVDHHQVEKKGQEQEVWEDVNHKTGAKAQLPVQTHPRYERERHARAQISHQQAEEEVVGRVVELPVAGDGQDDDEVGQDDGGGQRDGDGVDELFLGQQSLGLVAVHRWLNRQAFSPSEPVSTPIKVQVPCSGAHHKCQISK